MKTLHKPAYHIFPAVRMIVFIILAAIIGFSCTKEIHEAGTEPVNAEKEIHFTIRLPYPARPPGSRSITDREENYISSLYVLSFRVDNNTEKFDYWREATGQQGNTNGTPHQGYSAVLKVSPYPQRLVFLANISDGIKQEIGQRNWSGVEKEQMLSQLHEIIDGPDNKWNAESVSDYRALPMWGESTPVTIDQATAGLDAPVPMLRMVARIDVQLDESTNGLTDKFRLGSVRLYNTNTKGNLVPNPENIRVVAGNIEILSPTIPAGVADYSERYKGPMVYEDISSPGQQGIAIRNAIYLFEAGSTTTHLQATCLVIGGYYGDDTEQTFYRVDFNSNDGQTPLSILRNHKYTVNIVDVKQPGYHDPDDAFHSKTEGLDVSILHWNEINIDEIWFDQVYYYSVSPRSFDPKGAESTGNSIRVDTDYPQWSYKVSHNSDPAANSTPVNWLTVTSHQPGQNYPGNGTVDHIAFNVESSNVNFRTAYIHVTAGRVTMTATVKQTHWETPAFTVYPTGTIIPPNGQVRKITATGTFATVDIRARDGRYSELIIINDGYIMNGVNNNSVDITIPAFPGPNQIRQVYIEYYNPLTGRWITIQLGSQRSYFWD